jgi:glycine oxidase
VGQGLAGSAVAFQLLKRNKKILVIDEQRSDTASRVAAGLFNPITGKNNHKTWMADALFPYLHQFYTRAEQITGERFFHPMPIYRPFISILEQNEWMGKSADESFRNFMEVRLQSQFSDAVHDKSGGLLLLHGGYLSTSRYLDSVRKYLNSNASVLDERFDDNDLEFASDGVKYRGWRAGKIIFCQGEHSLKNKWFSNVPIRPLKGEILTIKTAWDKDVILNRGVYMLPGYSSGEFKIGSTYNTNDMERAVSLNGRMELEEKLSGLLKLPFEVTDQSFGFRPTTPDRKPILGGHVKYSQIVIFNGLGTKGVTLAPYFSEVLVRWLENKEELNKQVSVTRYK